MAQLSKQDLERLQKAEEARLASNQAALALAVEVAAETHAVRVAEAAQARESQAKAEALAALEAASAEHQAEVAKEMARTIGQQRREQARTTKRGQYSPLGHREGTEGAQMDYSILAFIAARGEWPSDEALIAFDPAMLEFRPGRVRDHIKHVVRKHRDSIPAHVRPAD